MKTTTTTNVETWLASNPVGQNIINLRENIGAAKGIEWNGITVFYNKAEIHIYMPIQNLTPTVKTQWMNKLSSEVPDIEFKINALEDFVN